MVDQHVDLGKINLVRNFAGGQTRNANLKLKEMIIHCCRNDVKLRLNGLPRR